MELNIPLECKSRKKVALKSYWPNPNVNLTGHSSLRKIPRGAPRGRPPSPAPGGEGGSDPSGSNWEALRGGCGFAGDITRLGQLFTVSCPGRPLLRAPPEGAEGGSVLREKKRQRGREREGNWDTHGEWEGDYFYRQIQMQSSMYTRIPHKKVKGKREKERKRARERERERERERGGERGELWGGGVHPVCLARELFQGHHRVLTRSQLHLRRASAHRASLSPRPPRPTHTHAHTHAHTHTHTRRPRGNGNSRRKEKKKSRK